ncbi:NUDIX hydrolase [Candidatus Woesearchaeota archaeon]|nr:NUDIX hydrolase [Candidatus Woesearchaeota archaeon]
MDLEYCADAIALYEGKLVLVERLGFPKGFAFPGGRRDRVGGGELFESVEDCAKREFQEETGLALVVDGVLGTYDAPNRDPRGPKISTVVYGTASGTMRSEPGKTQVFLMAPDEVDLHKDMFAFDHYSILKDWQEQKGKLYK